MNRRGFTLVEVLVAMVILAVGLLATTHLSITYVRANTFNQELSGATLLAEEKMEVLRRYGTTDQPGNFAVFGFGYLVSTDALHTTLADGTAVSGLCSGSNGGAAATNTAGTVYEALSALAGGSYGNGQVFQGADTVALSTGTQVNRTWTVEPITLRGRTDYARVKVTAAWTGRSGQTRDVKLESMFSRR